MPIVEPNTSSVSAARRPANLLPPVRDVRLTMPACALPYWAAAAPVVTETSSKPFVRVGDAGAAQAAAVVGGVRRFVPAATKPLPRLPGCVADAVDVERRFVVTAAANGELLPFVPSATTPGCSCSTWPTRSTGRFCENSPSMRSAWW